MSAAASIGPALFARFRRLIYDQAGIQLRDGKEALLQARLAKRMRALSIGSPRRYLTYLQEDDSGAELVHFLDVVATNFTSFFREREHFEVASEQLRRWRDDGQRRFRLWCAAASTGEEPYSLAMAATTALGPGADLKILATDISTRALGVAERATYDDRAVAPLTRYERSHFLVAAGLDGDGEREPRRDHGAWQVRPRIRELVTLRRLNLSTPPFPMKGPFDVVLCRNVMIYFDTAVRRRLVNDAARLLRDDGLLMIGHAETLNGIGAGLTMVRPSIYRKQTVAKVRRRP